MCSQTNFPCCVAESTAHSPLLQGNEFSLAPSLLAANAANLTLELDVQRRFKFTAMVAQADKLRNHIQIISEMTEDESQHLQKCVGYKLPIVGNIYLNYPFQLHGMMPRPLWTSPDKDGHVWSVACQTKKLGLPTVRVEGNPRVQECWLEEHVDYELYADPSNIDVFVRSVFYSRVMLKISQSLFARLS